MEEETIPVQSVIRTVVIVGVCVGILLTVIIVWYVWTNRRAGTPVFHSGLTYTGPTPSAAPNQAPAASGDVFTAEATTPWIEYQGEIYPYTFEAPQTLNVVRLGENPYDIYAVSWKNILPESNVLIGVDNLNNNENLRQYVNEPKISYVENWWRQFGALNGVASITPFTNAKGLKGYKAKYLSGGQPSKTDDVFIEVPGRKELVIHLANGVLDKPIFDRIVDSVSFASGSATTR